MLKMLALSVLLLQGGVVRQQTALAEGAAPLQSKLATRAKGYESDGDDFVEALLKVADRYKIPMGIVWVRTDSALRPLKVSKKGVTVRQIIQSLIATQPGFKMEIRGGVVHVFAPGLIPNRENFLKLTVPDFQVHNQILGQAELWLDDMVNNILYPPRPQQAERRVGGTGHSMLAGVGDPKFSLTMRNSTVEDILDALTLASGRGVWLVAFSAAGELTPTGYRKSESPASKGNTERRAKPYWEILRWGREPY